MHAHLTRQHTLCLRPYRSSLPPKSARAHAPRLCPLSPPSPSCPPGQLETIPCQLVLVSIGYRSLPVEGAPFDAKRGVIPNKEGRVLQGTSPQAPGADVDAVDPGLYVCGWLKRGPTGIIGTNALDADETVASICADVTAGGVGRGDVRGAEGLRALLRGKGVQAVDFPGWLCVDEAEVAAGKAAGKVGDGWVGVASANADW